MQKLFTHSINHFFSTLEALPVGAVSVITVSAFVGIVRTFLEILVEQKGHSQLFFSPFAVLHSIAFYVATYVLFVFVLSHILPNKKQNIAPVVLFGILCGLLPPLVDLICNLPIREYTYFAEFSWNFFNARQSLGESIVVWGIIVGTGMYGWYATKLVRYGFMCAVASYAVLQFEGFIVNTAGNALLQKLYPVLGLTAVPATELSIYKSIILSQLVFSVVWTFIAIVICILGTKNGWCSTLRHIGYAIAGIGLFLCGASAGSELDVYIFCKASVVAAAIFLMDRLYERSGEDTKQGFQMPLQLFLMALLTVSFVFFDPSFSVLLALTFFVAHMHVGVRRVYANNVFIECIMSSIYIFIALLAGVFAFSAILVPTVIMPFFYSSLFLGIFFSLESYVSPKIMSRNDRSIVTWFGVPSQTIYLVLQGVRILWVAGTIGALFHFTEQPMYMFWLGTFFIISTAIPILVSKKVTYCKELSLIQGGCFLIFVGVAVIPIIRTLFF